jgi:hypothetical protein
LAPTPFRHYIVRNVTMRDGGPGRRRGHDPIRCLRDLQALAELAIISDQHPALGPASALLPDTSRWKPALSEIAEHRYEDAARLHQEIGGQPLAAQAHLLAARQGAQDGRHAAANHHAEQALALL